MCVGLPVPQVARSNSNYDFVANSLGIGHFPFFSWKLHDSYLYVVLTYEAFRKLHKWYYGPHEIFPREDVVKLELNPGMQKKFLVNHQILNTDIRVHANLEYECRKGTSEREREREGTHTTEKEAERRSGVMLR